jgi:hypothetical protein
MKVSLLKQSRHHAKVVLWELYRPLLHVAAKIQSTNQVQDNLLQAHVRRLFRRTININNDERIQLKVQEGRQVNQSGRDSALQSAPS